MKEVAANSPIPGCQNTDHRSAENESAPGLALWLYDHSFMPIGTAISLVCRYFKAMRSMHRPPNQRKIPVFHQVYFLLPNKKIRTKLWVSSDISKHLFQEVPRRACFLALVLRFLFPSRLPSGWHLCLKSPLPFTVAGPLGIRTRFHLSTPIQFTQL